MTEDTKCNAFWATVVAIAVTCLCVGSVKCNNSDNIMLQNKAQHITECVKTTQKPLECRFAYR